MLVEIIGWIKGQPVAKGDRVTFRYNKPGVIGVPLQVRVGTVDAVIGGAVVMEDDDKNGQYRSFSGNLIHDFVVL